MAWHWARRVCGWISRGRISCRAALAKGGEFGGQSTGAVIQGDENTGGAMARDCRLLAAARRLFNGLPRLAPKARKTEGREFGLGGDGIFQTISAWSGFNH